MAELLTYVFFALIPIGDGTYLRYSAEVESREDCLTLRTAWIDKWTQEDFDTDKHGSPQVACIKAISV